MIDAVTIAELTAAASAEAPIGQTTSDLVVLAPLYEQVKAGKFDLEALVTGPNFKTTMDALTRSAALVDKLVNDPVQGPRVVALIKSLA